MAKQKSKILKYFLIVLIIIVALELVLFIYNKANSLKIENKDLDSIKESSFSQIDNLTKVTIKLPAVDEEGKGVSTRLSVEAFEGSGRTLVDIENLLFWADTQQSIRMARYVAGNYTKNELENYNLIYSVDAKNASLIGGPSAGAALTIATIFALNGKELNPDVMITGTVNHDGSIGPVGAVLEKAKASKQAGAKIFLVPLLQSRDVIYEENEYCQKFGYTEVCSTEVTPKQIDVSKEAGIEVIEVANIQEALKYFSI